MSNYDEFRDVMGKIEKELKRILRISADNRATLGKLLDIGKDKSSLVDSVYEDLKMYKDIRNIFEHNMDSRNAVLVTDETLMRLRNIHQLLKNPPRVDKYLKGKPSVVEKNDQIDVVLKNMLKNDFSQVPVIDGKQITGLLTTNTIARWVGYKLSTDRIVDNENTVEDVMNHAESLSNYSYISRNSNLFEVIEKFTESLESNPYFDALLITEKGECNQELLGIVTKSDLSELHIFIKNNYS